MSDERLLTDEQVNELYRRLTVEGHSLINVALNAFVGHVRAQQDEITRLREALAWYADRDNHRDKWNGAGFLDEMHFDQGERARAALDREAAGE